MMYTLTIRQGGRASIDKQLARPCADGGRSPPSAAAFRAFGTIACNGRQGCCFHVAGQMLGYCFLQSRYTKPLSYL